MNNPPSHLSKLLSAQATGSKKRILVVDDEEFVCNLITKVLSRHLGLEVETARDGGAAIAATLAGRYDGAIINLVLPRTSGLEAIRTIKTMLPRFPIIAMSTAVSGRSLKSIEKFGVTAILFKPFKMADLIDKVNGIWGADKRVSDPK